MTHFREWLRRAWYLVNRRRLDALLQAEMEAHRAEMPHPVRFGNVLRLREEAGDVWGWNWLDDLGRDVRLGLRTLRRAPGFTLASVVILSVGIGLNLTLFQVVNIELIRPLEIPNPDRVVRFHRRAPTLDSSAVTYAVAAFVRENNTVLSAVLASRPDTLAWGDPAERVTAAFVSANWFDEFGGSPAAGRLLHEGIDSAPSAPAVVVLHQGFWQRRLGGHPDVVGSTVLVNGRPAVVAGVVDARFPRLDKDTPEIWLPIEQIEYYRPGTRLTTDISMYGRLRRGVSLPAAKASLQVTLGRLAEVEPARVGAGEWLEPYSGSVRFMAPRERQRTWMQVAAVATLSVLVLMIACLNLGNLTLARAITRVREMSIRTALGAGRWRIVRHLIIESWLLACAGACGGLLLGFGAVSLLLSMVERSSTVATTLDWRTSLAAMAAALVSMAAVGLAPAWKIGRRNLALAARDGGERVSRGLHSPRLRDWLVACQIAGSCVLLVVAGQMVQSLQRALAPERGFSMDRLAVLEPSLESFGVAGAAAQGYWDTVRALIATHPETAQVALVDRAPPGSSQRSRYPSAPHVLFRVLSVDANFLATLQIPMLAGRTFQPGDGRDVVIVSRRGAMGLYGTLDVIGQPLPKEVSSPRIIGIAGDARLSASQSEEMAEVYRPLLPQQARAMLVRAKTDPSLLVAALRDASLAADSRVVPEVRVLRDDFDQDLRSSRIAGTGAALIALIALALVSVGIFGVVSYTAGLQTKEIGIRLALGATRGSTMRALLRHTLSRGAAGMAAGLAGGWAAGKAFAGEPFHLMSLDVPTYGAVTALFLSVALTAALLPAWLTLRRDPLRALRCE